MRDRPTTIGPLGRAPARASKEPQAGSQPPPPEPGAVRRWIHSALFDNLGLKFLSIVLAVTVFLLVNTDRDSEITKVVAVSYTMPDDKVLVSDHVDEVRVTIRGPWRRLRRVNERPLDPIELDLRHARSGEVAITPDMFHLPTGLTVASISPGTVHVVFDRRVEKVVEVSPQVAGHPQHGYVVSDVKAAPTTIKVRGAEGTLAALSVVRTREVSVDGRAETFTKDPDVDLPEGVEAIGSRQVSVHVTVDEELVTRKLPGLVVSVHGDGIDPAKWSLDPAQVDVTLTGALLAVEKARAALAPTVKLSAADGRPHYVDVVVEGLAPGIGVKVSPERVKVAPVKAAPAPSPPP